MPLNRLIGFGPYKAEMIVKGAPFITDKAGAVVLKPAFTTGGFVTLDEMIYLADLINKDNERDKT